MKQTKEEIAADKAAAMETLRKVFPPGSTAHTALLHTSASGMSRVVMLVGTDPETKEPRNYSWAVARATGWKLHKKYDGVTIGGAGMDMGFHLVYTMSRIIHKDSGYVRPNGGNSDAGYAVSHRWL